MVASNTRDCFRVCIGKRVRGVLFGALPMGRPDLAAGTKTLVFDDGTGLTIGANGSFWVESEDEIGRAIKARRAELEDAKRDIAETIMAAGPHRKEATHGHDSRRQD